MRHTQSLKISMNRTPRLLNTEAVITKIRNIFSFWEIARLRGRSLAKLDHLEGCTPKTWGGARWRAVQVDYWQGEFEILPREKHLDLNVSFPRATSPRIFWHQENCHPLPAPIHPLSTFSLILRVSMSSRKPIMASSNPYIPKIPR